MRAAARLALAATVVALVLAVGWLAGPRWGRPGGDDAVPFEPFRWEELGTVHDPVYTRGGLAILPPQPTPRPEALHALSGRRVEARGFVVGLEVTHRGLKRFILIRHRAPCCFGRGPLPGVWVEVDLPDGGEIPFDPWRPVEVRGTLEAVVAPAGTTYLAMHAEHARPLDQLP